MKRYDTYKDSGIEWIGEIPEHWGRNKLSYCFNKIGSGTTPKSTNQDYYFNGKFNWLQTGDLNDGNIINTSKKITQKALDDYSTLRFYPKESIVIAMYGATIGKMGLLNIETTTNQACCVLAEPKNVISKFVFYWFQSIKKHIISISYGGGQPNINQEQIRTLQIQLPSKQEQTAIANYLDQKTTEIDQLITQKETLLKHYTEEKTAIINQAVTKGINPNVKLKDSGVDWLGDIPVHWEVKRFNFIFSFSRGLSITKANLKTSGIPCINYGEIHSKCRFEVNPAFDTLKYVDEKYLESSKKSLLNRGDFVFADTSEDIEGSGNFTYLNIEIQVFAGYHTIITRIKRQDKFLARYIAYFLESLSFRNQIRCEVRGTKVYSITQLILKNTKIAFPKFDEQQSIVLFIDEQTTKINTKITNTKKLITLLKEYKTALISEVVTGKIKVS